MIPKRYEDVKFEQLPKVVKDVYPKLRNERKGIYLWGGVGTGKTYAAYGIYKKWQEDRTIEEDTRKQIQEKYNPQNGMKTKENGEMYYFEDIEIKKKQEEALAQTPKIRPEMRVENVPQMLYYAKRDYQDKNNNYQDSVLNSVRVFVLDDIGVEKVSEFVEEFMYMLINGQYEKVYPIVITSNLPLSQLAERLGDRIVSRIKEMCEIIEIKGEDRRLTK
jgi:DNA replication protein DnaC